MNTHLLNLNVFAGLQALKIQHQLAQPIQRVSAIPQPRARMRQDRPVLWHGTLAGTTRHQCACAACRLAMADYQRAYRQKVAGAR